MTENLLDVVHVSQVFRTGGLFFGTRLVAVDDVSLSLNGARPTILSIVGESGSGKTTLARILLRLIEPTAGQVKVRGNDIFGKDKTWNSHTFRMTLQPIFQNPFETFSIYKTVDTYLYETTLNLKIAKNRRDASDIIAATLKSIGLDLNVVQGKYAHQFSGGELQRISVARAMIPKPRLVIADEPVSMIDASIRMNLINLFLELKTTNNVSFIYITHDLSTAYYVSDFIAIMFRGSIVEYGPSHSVFTAPEHPYTELLMQSVPKIGEKWEEDADITDLESVNHAGTACKFAARCPYRKDICTQAAPPMVQMGDQRQVLCYRPVNYQASVAQAVPLPVEG